MHTHTIELPSLRTLARSAGPHLLEGTLAPVALFYGSLRLFGLWAALGAALVWSYGALSCRMVARRRISGILLLGVATLTARTLLAALSGSVFVYFLQPTLGTALVGIVFLASVPAGRPLAGRLAQDVCGLPPSFTEHSGVRRFFSRLSLLWAGVCLANAGVSLWLLTHRPVASYVVERPIVSLLITGVAIGVSARWFFRSMRRHGITIRRAVA
jgi:hypothetical protein